MAMDARLGSVLFVLALGVGPLAERGRCDTISYEKVLEGADGGVVWVRHAKSSTAAPPPPAGATLQFKATYNVEEAWDGIYVKVLDAGGRPLRIGGVLVEFFPVPPGDTEVSLIHPPPPGRRWVEFRSNALPLPTSVSRGRGLVFRVVAQFVDARGQRVDGEEVLAWISDDTDDSYGFLVQDGLCSLVTRAGAEVSR